MSEESASPKPKKQRRNPRACDLCHRRSVRCRPSLEVPGQCQNCADYAETCTFNRALKKRGAKPKQEAQPGLRVAGTTDALQQHFPSGEATESRHDAGRNGPVDHPEGEQLKKWPAILCTQAQVMDLTEIYFEVVFPVFPVFHRPTLRRRISRGEHMTDQSFFVTVMALCALSSARARDGALYSQNWELQSLLGPTSEEFFHAAEEAMPRDATLMQDFDYMRAAALLAITSIQYGKPQLMNHYLSLYHGFVAVGGLHDEANWPPDRGLVETEERRRLFWSTYTLDVFTSIIWGGIVRSREASSNVGYPTEVDDQTFDNTTHSPQSSSSNGKPSWLQGWNFVTDLYRILEHCVDHLRRPRLTARDSWPAQASIYGVTITTQTHVLQHMSTMYNGLPSIFKTTEPISCNLEKDLYSFQAANIAATVQLVRMVHLNNEQSTLEQKCQVASEVIAGFASVPVAYLRAISSPLLHHLGGIGTILGATFEDGMTESAYILIRSVLLDLANLLANLEADMFCPSGTSEKLRSQVSRIDQYMGTQCARENWLDYARENSLDMPSRSPLLQSQTQSTAMPDSLEYHFPPELFHDWSWAINMP